MATTKAEKDAELLIPLFQLDRPLKQDQNGRRMALLGSINSQPALITLERAPFPTESSVIKNFLSGISEPRPLGSNDIYHWYMAFWEAAPNNPARPPDLKLNLIYPCTQQHIKKYSPQTVRMVTETADIYAQYVQPYMRRKREQGRLNWVINIIEGRTEQEDVILRDKGGGDGSDEGFLLLPDLNWDRKTIGSLHLLALVERRDIWSLRDLRKGHVGWLASMRERILNAVVGKYGEKGIEEDMLKLYVHYQPTYYHFHIHVVNVMLEAGTTQAIGKAFGLENIISQLEAMDGRKGREKEKESSMADVSLTYFLGEESELWEKVFGPLKRGEAPAVDLES